MKGNLLLYGLFIIGLCIGACKSDETMEPSTYVPGGGVDTIQPGGEEQYLNKDSEYIFDQQKIHTFELTIPEAALAKINADPTAEEYVVGSLTFEGETISPIGVRYKGSIGAFVGCVSGPDWANPSGHKTCTKLSMKVKINWADSDATFYGLKKLQFHSQNNDPSQMRERLGYWLFREMGVIAPRSVHARLMINGQYSGIYALTEQIDGRFTKEHFNDGDGNLYKEIWPLKDNGQAFSQQTYLNHLKTNEDKNPSAALIQKFAQEIANADANNIQNTVSTWMDMDKMIAYAVVDRTIRNDDGAFHWYCGGDGCSSHNFYWYEEPNVQKMHLIPWDLDHAFENIIFNQNPVTPIADGWGQITANCSPFSYGVFGFQQRSAACDKLTNAWTQFTEEYEQTLLQFKGGPFSEATVIGQLNNWQNQIHDATLEANQAHSDAISINQWENALATLKNQLEYARTH